MNESEMAGVAQCAQETADFIEYILVRDKDLSRTEAAWIAASVLAGLPELFTDNELLSQCLDATASEFKAATKRKR